MWKLTVGCHQLAQVVTPIAAAIPDAISFVKRMNIALHISYTEIDWAFLLLLQLLTKIIRSHLIILISDSSDKKAPQGFVRAQVPFPNLNEANYFAIPQNIMLAHYLDNITPIQSGERKLAGILTSFKADMRVN